MNKTLQVEINTNHLNAFEELGILTNRDGTQRISKGDTIHFKEWAVVEQNVPAFAVVVGVPAKIIKYRFSEEVINRLLELNWWNYHVNQFSSFDFDQPIEEAVSILSENIKNAKEEDRTFSSLRLRDLD